MSDQSKADSPERATLAAETERISRRMAAEIDETGEASASMLDAYEANQRAWRDLLHSEFVAQYGSERAAYTGPTITHQAVELHGNVTVCWSKWDDGHVTRSASYWINGIQFLGHDERAAPPVHLQWVDTVALARDMKAGKP